MIPRWFGLQEAAQALANHQVIAYPTEAVFGLGCACTQDAIKALQQLKERPKDKGWIALVPSFEAVSHWVAPLEASSLALIKQSWPGPITLVLPASDEAPPELVAHNGCIALRVSAHPVVQALMQYWQKPLLSTSANLPGQPPARFGQAVMNYFPEMSGIVPGQVDLTQNPTAIIDGLSGEYLRT